MKEKIQAYRPAAAAFLVMMAMSLTSTCMSFFLGPICEHLQVGRGSVSIVFSLMTVTGALMNPVLGQYAGKNGVRNILLVCGLWTCVGMFLFSTANSLWILYAVSFAMGAFATSCVALCGNVIVQQAYMGPQASSILGVVMAGSGVGGMIFSLIIPGIISAQGWQTGIRVMALLWLGLLWLAAFILGNVKPMQLGSVNGAVGLGMTRQEAMKSPKLYMQMVVIIVICACCGIQQQIPSLLASYGFESGRVSVMVSMLTAFLAVGKVAQGVLYGRLGIQKGGYLMMVIWAVGFLALANKALVYPALIMVAFGLGIYTTLLPQVARATFGSREYASIWSLIATAGSVGSFIATPVWGLVYDLTGSYTLGLFVAPVLLAFALVALVLNFRKKD